MTISDSDLAAMRARCEAASEAPWLGASRKPLIDGPPFIVEFQRAADIVFILSARTDLPRLLDEVEWLRANLAQLRRAAARHYEECDGGEDSDLREALEYK